MNEDRAKKGYGIKGGGKTDENGKVPLILKVEYLFNKYEKHKDNLRGLSMFREA